MFQRIHHLTMNRYFFGSHNLDGSSIFIATSWHHRRWLWIKTNQQRERKDFNFNVNQNETRQTKY